MKKKLAMLALAVAMTGSIATTTTLINSELSIEAHAADEANIKKFVERMYTKALERGADANGCAYWVERLVNKTDSAASCAQGFFGSNEFQAKSLTDKEYLTILYHTFFDREPDDMGRMYWEGMMQNGTSRTTVLENFIISNEFSKICESYGMERGELGSTSGNDGGSSAGNNTSSADATLIRSFVERMYTKALGREKDANGCDYWVSRLVSGEDSAASCAYGFITSDELIGKKLENEDFVITLYRTFFDREADKSGKEYWVNLLSSGQQSRYEVLCGFVNSNEFGKLCKDYGMERGELDPNDQNAKCNTREVYVQDVLSKFYREDVLGNKFEYTIYAAYGKTVNELVSKGIVSGNSWDVIELKNPYTGSYTYYRDLGEMNNADNPRDLNQDYFYGFDDDTVVRYFKDYEDPKDINDTTSGMYYWHLQYFDTIDWEKMKDTQYEVTTDDKYIYLTYLEINMDEWVKDFREKWAIAVNNLQPGEVIYYGQDQYYELWGEKYRENTEFYLEHRDMQFFNNALACKREKIRARELQDDFTHESASETIAGGSENITTNYGYHAFMNYVSSGMHACNLNDAMYEHLTSASCLKYDKNTLKLVKGTNSESMYNDMLIRCYTTGDFSGTNIKPE